MAEDNVTIEPSKFTTKELMSYIYKAQLELKEDLEDHKKTFKAEMEKIEVNYNYRLREIEDWKLIEVDRQEREKQETDRVRKEFLQKDNRKWTIFGVLFAGVQIIMALVFKYYQ